MEREATSIFNNEFVCKWHGHYAKLKAYVNQQQCPGGAPDEKMLQWIKLQRRIRHMLPDELKERLAELNLVGEEANHSWEDRYKQLSHFKQETGHTALPDAKQYEPLKDWLVRQIINKRLLTEKQHQLLDQLGVNWDMSVSRDHRWEVMFWRLSDFYKSFGHCRVPQLWANDKQLAHWVRVQRLKHAQGKLRQDRERRLNELNFTWTIQVVYDAQWQKFFQALLSFRNRYGHMRVPANQEKLVSWIERQRLARKKNQLPPDRVKRLDEIGFIWSCEEVNGRSWDEKFAQLKAYKKKHGHSFVPANCKDNRSLGIWVSTQRGLEAKGELQAVKKKKLDQLGFVWSRDMPRKLQSVSDAHWMASLEKLKAYKQKHGTCQVSLKIDPVLQRWTSWQRKLFYQGKLSQDRIDKLQEIRFSWNVQEGYWQKMYEALVAFRNTHGHTQVPCQGGPNPKLSAWLYRLRANKQALSHRKVELLNQLGLDWSLRKKTLMSWESMYKQLVAFKKEHHHTRVPVKWPPSPRLGKWVSRMRYERGKLDPERLAL
ncbi:MAG: helicase associated domain-containing protein, partial [Adhaeribacter sp.]